MTAAIALLAFGAVTVALALQLPLGTLRMPGTGFFPLVLGLLLVALAATQGMRLLLARARAPAPATPAPAPAPAASADGATRRVAFFIGVVALATLLLQPLGYVVATLLLMVGLLRVLGVAWRASALIAVSAALASHVVFVRWLGIPMPAGPLGF